MSEKTNPKDSHSAEIASDFELRDLNEHVLARLQEKVHRESEMIANFNANVNKVDIEKTSHTSESQSEQGDTNMTDPKSSSQLDPTRYGDWEKKGRCFDF